VIMLAHRVLLRPTLARSTTAYKRACCKTPFACSASQDFVSRLRVLPSRAKKLAAQLHTNANGMPVDALEIFELRPTATLSEVIVFCVTSSVLYSCLVALIS